MPRGISNALTFIQITTACNAQCLMCDMWKKPVRHMPISTVKNLLDLISKKNPMSEIRFTGGEPCLHPHFEKILYEVKSRGMSISVITNGTFLNNFSSLNRKIDLIFLSIDSPYYNDQLRIRGIRVNESPLFYKKLHIIANVIASKLNINCIKEIPEWLKKNGIGTINLIPMKTPKYMLPESDLENVFIQVLRICNLFNVKHFFEGNQIKRISPKIAIQALKQRTSVEKCHIHSLINFIDIDKRIFQCNSTPHRKDTPATKRVESYNDCQAYRMNCCDLSNIIYNFIINRSTLA